MADAVAKRAFDEYVMRMMHHRCHRLAVWGMLVLLTGVRVQAYQPATWQEEKWTPVQLSLLWPYQLFHETYNVRGFRLGVLTTENRDVYGLDLGLINGSERFGGVQFCGYEAKTRDAAGVQLALGFVRVDDYDAWGVQLAGLGISVRDFRGVQLAGVLNYNRHAKGVLFALYETNADTLSGIQLAGLHGMADELSGVQFAVGLAEVHRQPMAGVQLAGLMAEAPRLRGLQFALGVDRIRSETFRGAQIAGLAAFAVPARTLPEGASPADEPAVVETDGYGLQLATVVCENFSLSGAMLALGWNDTRNTMDGLQFAVVLNHASEMDGLQFGVAFNHARGVDGIQLALFNSADQISGLQFGAVNSADIMDGGLQFGLINYSRQLKGVQIGLLNVGRNCYVPCLPLVNAKF
jgi:hypothetical protein